MYNIDIKACNEVKECAINSFDIEVVNNDPIVVNPLQNQTAIMGISFNYVFLANTFFDSDGHSLTYTAKLSDDSPLPKWLSFNSLERKFFGIPNKLATYPIKVTAADGYTGSVFSNFNIVVKSRVAPIVVNSISDQNTIVGEFFELTIGGNNVFNSSSALFLEATNIPTWLDFLLLNLNPTLKGSYDTLGYWSVGVAVSENYAFVGDYGSHGSSLRIIDISDPSNPTFKGSCDTPGWAYSVVLSGNYVYVGGAYDDTSGFLQIIDISDPSNPTLEGSYDTPDRVFGAALSGNYAYVANLGLGLQIIDINDPSNPTLEGSYDMPGSACGVTLSGNYAYIAGGFSGLQIVDIKDPSKPTLEGSYDIPGQVWDVVVSGNYAYVANLDSGLQIIDISYPSNLTLEGSYDTPGSACGVTLSGNYAYVAVSYSSSLQIVDIRDPSNPTFKGSCDTPDSAREVALSGNYAYVADGFSGLQIIALNPNKLTLSGIPRSVGTYSVDIKACNEIMECTTDSFNITVKNFLNADLTTILRTFDLMSVTVFSVCVASFCILLIIGSRIVMHRQYRNKILGNESKAKIEKIKKTKKL
jgi:hypothetical protein